MTSDIVDPRVLDHRSDADDRRSAMLEIVGLRVDYRDFTLGPIDLDVAAGTFLTLVGPNGSGKTTLIRSTLGLQVPTAGTSCFEGHDLALRDPNVLARVGYVTDSGLDLLEEFTIEEYWQYCRVVRPAASPGATSRMQGLALTYADRLQLPLTRKPLTDLSLGTRRKAQLIATLMTEPELLVLDEVFSGLDFLASRALEDILREQWRGGATVVSSSHDLEIASRLSSHIALLHAGELRLHEAVTDIGGPERIEDRLVAALSQPPR